MTNKEQKIASLIKDYNDTIQTIAITTKNLKPLGQNLYKLGETIDKYPNSVRVGEDSIHGRSNQGHFLIRDFDRLVSLVSTLQESNKAKSQMENQLRHFGLDSIIK